MLIKHILRIKKNPNKNWIQILQISNTFLEQSSNQLDLTQLSICLILLLFPWKYSDKLGEMWNSIFVPKENTNCRKENKIKCVTCPFIVAIGVPIRWSGSNREKGHCVAARGKETDCHCPLPKQTWKWSGKVCHIKIVKNNTNIIDCYKSVL